MKEHPWLASYPKNIDWHHMVDAKPLYTLLDRAATKFPEHTAIDFLGKSYSYQKLHQRVASLACGLKKIGVSKGDRVGIMMPNCPQFIFSYFAILKAGGIVVNFNPLYSKRELKHQIDDSGCEIMMTVNLSACYPKLRELLQATRLRMIVADDFANALPFPAKILFPLLKRKDIVPIPDDMHHIHFREVLHPHADCEEEMEPPEINPDQDIAVLQYTGGTTGTPKGTMLTHANLYANAIQCGLWMEGMEDGEESILGVLPLFHVFAMTTIMNLGIHKGAKLILHPRFELIKVLKTIQKKKPTLMPGVPTMFTALNLHKNVINYNLSSLKACISGGAPLPLEVKETFETLTGCSLVEGYGLSESSPVVCANPLAGKNKAGSIGLPFPQTIVEIDDIENPGKLMKAGEKGELCVRGPQVMKGYWHNKDETDNVLQEGRLRTGDVAFMDEEGYVFIVDRLKEVIISGGYNIYPRNVEEAIYLNDAIKEVAAIGIPDEYRGQVVKVFVALKDGKTLSGQGIKEFLKDKLAPFQLPSEIEFLDELPKTMIGKIDKKQLINNMDKDI